MIKLKQFKGRIADSLNSLYQSLDIKFDIKGNEINWKVVSLYNECLNDVEKEDYESLEKNLKRIIIEKGEIKFEITEFKEINSDISLIKNSFSIPLNDENSLGDYDFGPYLGTNIDSVREKIHSAKNILKTCSPNYYYRVSNLIETMIIVGRNPNGEGIRSGSTIASFGCVINRPEGSGEVLQYIEDLVHESTHHMVFLEQHCDHLIKNSNQELFPAPFRQDQSKRPMSTQFHSALVLGNVVICMEQIRKAYDGDPILISGIDEKIEQMSEWFYFCCATIEKYGDLTNRGTEMIREIQENVRNQFKELTKA